MRRFLLFLGLAAVTMGCTPTTRATQSVAPLPPSISIHDEVVMIFFDSGKANLTDKAQEVVERAAETFVATHAEREIVSGYCDTAEIAKGCAPLALRRANAVKAALMRLGVPEGAIVTLVSADLLVATPPNTHEPQNRHVVVEPH